MGPAPQTAGGGALAGGAGRAVLRRGRVRLGTVAARPLLRRLFTVACTTTIFTFGTERTITCLCYTCI